MLNVEMLSTGDEVLHGQIVDTNAAWLADFFFNQGLPLTRRNTVGDDLDALVAILRERSEQADVLIVNGGLGPTSDDLSALAAATAKGEGLILHPEWLETMTRFFAERGRPMAESNRKQAEIPASAEMINNPVGTACGFAIQLNRCLMFFTPGVPSEFKVMVEQEILPRLRQRFTLPDPPVCLRLTTFGRSESELAQSLNPLTLPPGVVMGYRSSMPIIELKLTGPANQRDAMLALWPEVRKVAGDSLIFEGTEGLPAQIARCLQERQLSLTLSEQFTGGLLALQLSRAGAPLLASEVVPAQEETLAQAARWAAERRINHFAGLALAVSGQENDHLNVALATPDGTFALRVKFSATRHSLAVRQEVCAMMALNMLRRWLNGQPLASEHGWINVVDSLSL
ncbi:TPA: nicotinamide mononucleotide deamidase-related protein YfaY [Klebsiella pneumoniae]|jgi:competence/damage-inducible protein CinA-like protein|uniref:nicotinamide mononucleotide deamidase-related protein YfaY n=1 Tax=Klebsiella pneumoniae TaxID=573 RepID=UPI000E2A8B8A|nr:nicotinamide mononucleotide deamidase-related protein YfaY [Klebsiella pneumoniae]VEC51844.1 Competence/damage-inducible protein CinA [Klebsiella aerogenes]HDT1629465.1 nicotinamide mononucleotide deamidase-related protein YfaY [Klebsiella pneumoniae subsp. ozaenae]HEO9195265.1 nicotinamide mononucleotide deamidase-related protein YfaY [Klebsiella pneumoniae subsp. pneumoniae]EKJ5234189.1 nicotinamide mononucleotide deamidase-related protein YfaY [Klebsiella pneumoniae]EKV7523737.1 nicotina